jgi:hypothetical protein
MRGIGVISFHCCLLSLNAWKAYIKEQREYNFLPHSLYFIFHSLSQLPTTGPTCQHDIFFTPSSPPVFPVGHAVRPSPSVAASRTSPQPISLPGVPSVAASSSGRRRPTTTPPPLSSDECGTSLPIGTSLSCATTRRSRSRRGGLRPPAGATGPSR